MRSRPGHKRSRKIEVIYRTCGTCFSLISAAEHKYGVVYAVPDRFQQVTVKVRSQPGQKGQILIKLNKKDVFLVQFNLRNSMGLLVSVWDVYNRGKSQLKLYNYICRLVMCVVYAKFIFFLAL